MRLVQLVSDTDRRGAQVFATTLGSALQARGVEVRTLALTPGASGSRLELAALTRSRSWVAALRPLRTETAAADVVIAHGSTTLPACALGLARRTPFVYRSIGDLPRWVGGGLRRRRVRWMLQRARGVSVLWPELVPYVRDQLGVDESHIEVIPNAVDASRFAPQDRAAARAALELDPARPVVAHVGALSPEKQVDRLVEAAASMDVQLVLAGDGPERVRLEKLASTTGGSTRFLGNLTDPTPVYAAADVVALASATEGQPAVLIEAALSGRAVVARRTGGVGALVDDGTTGVLYDGGPDALVAALRTALDGADALGAAAPAWARARFDIGIVADHWHEWLGRI